MTEFEMLMKHAIGGNREAQAKVLLLVEPIINHYSTFNGKMDEDLRQQIILRILVEQKKWKGVQKNDG